MSKIKKMLPLICTTVAIVVILAILCVFVTGMEMQRGWEQLDSSVDTVSEQIRSKFEDEIIKLRLIENIFVKEQADGSYKAEDIEFLFDERLYTSAVFTRLDIVTFTDTYSVALNKMKYEPRFSFKEAFDHGEGMTERYTDPVTGKECVCYVLPVYNDGKECFALLGVIECEKLHEMFVPDIYGGNVEICVIDSRDGSYVLDSWHSALGNAFDDMERERVRGYEDVDFKGDVKSLKTGTIAFESKTVGRPLYMRYAPIGMFEWELSVFLDEGVLFADAIETARVLICAGVVIIAFLALYFIWNIRIVNKLEKNKRELELQRETLALMTYNDVLTSMYNRRRFMDDLKSMKGKDIPNAGVIYMDLNGLKSVNDTRSHAIGDEYLRAAAYVILSVFDDRCYRIGGDEFVVITNGMPYDELIEKLTLAHEMMNDKGVEVSVGYAFEDESNDMEKLIKDAERLMYAEKRKYYAENGRSKIPGFKSDIG